MRDVIKDPLLPQKPGHEGLARLEAELSGELRFAEEASGSAPPYRERIVGFDQHAVHAVRDDLGHTSDAVPTIALP